MARNEEKAQSMLYRFREAQKEELGISTTTVRPLFTNEVDNLNDAEKWRREVNREIQQKIDKIKDESLPEHQIRDLNDDINKSLKEKRRWELRIKELGGTDYIKRGPSLITEQGALVPGTIGYRYFGRAKDLPGIKELFDQAAKQQEDTKTTVIKQRVDADYYGFRDEEDGLVLQYEQEQEKQVKTMFLEKSKKINAPGPDFDKDFLPSMKLPSMKDVEAWLVERRREALKDKYLGNTTNNALTSQS